MLPEVLAVPHGPVWIGTLFQMDMDPIFNDFAFGKYERELMNRDGHISFPGLLKEDARRELTASLEYIESIDAQDMEGHEPRRFAAEFDGYLESLIGHPQMLDLARSILGDDVRFDHCVALNRPGGNGGSKWHTHGYGEENPALGFIRIFFYVNGFEAEDGGLKVLPGSHLLRARIANVVTNEELETDWLRDKYHPLTSEPFRIEALSVPSGTVIAMWTFAAHGVTPRKPGSDTRWCVVYAYRNPGLPSQARWISEDYEKRRIPGAEGMMSLY